jgi:hypothetical protein
MVKKVKNNYEIRGDVTALFIENPKYGPLEVLISTDKLEIVKDFPNSWMAKDGKCGLIYVVGHKRISGKQTIYYLHRLITNAPNGLFVDHIDGNGLNNTNGNLRIVTQAENAQNRRIGNNNKSGVCGVHWYDRYQKWCSRIGVNKRRIVLGYFDELEEAINAVKEARKKHMKFSNESRKIANA